MKEISVSEPAATFQSALIIISAHSTARNHHFHSIRPKSANVLLAGPFAPSALLSVLHSNKTQGRLVRASVLSSGELKFHSFIVIGLIVRLQLGILILKYAKVL